MNNHCIFCRIISGEFESTKVYEDDNILVIKDISPATPVHVLFLHKKHANSILDADSKMITDLMSKVPEVTKKLGIAEKGFRIVINTGDDGGQTVDHLHIHLLGGREMQWPPG